MSFGVEVRDLTVRYGRTTALDGVDLTLEPGRIHGLLGRNGSGKTSLLSVLAAFRPATSGTVLVDGEDPFENPRIMAGTCLVRESGDHMDDKARATLQIAAAVRPTWDAELAGRLVDRLQVPLDRKPSQMSRGQRSALGVVVGLASRAPLTMLDESYLGLDAPSRYAFYDELLADYAEHPRTIVVSSHLIEEVERLFEQVVVLDHGRVLLADDADALRARGATLTGPGDVVDAFLDGRRVLERRTLGRTAQVTVDGGLDDAERRRARDAGLEIGPVPLQDLFVHLTASGDRP
ncbi:ABC transporter ATP-binding protein [Actinotalea ferrariae]|uniref:ATP-binding cassette domain-containing protein n=1 Tax=Actinotalea ferrariae TaxID=1386098 RepID=UPI001C8BBF42|nr:ABC transporter ATP-binding protein [Actinotalea ferrariae]MBX9244715.1 ABC transporter ATP-binding protein [Actinotalea ferrariae]